MRPRTRFWRRWLSLARSAKQSFRRTALVFPEVAVSTPGNLACPLVLESELSFITFSKRPAADLYITSISAMVVGQHLTLAETENAATPPDSNSTCHFSPLFGYSIWNRATCCSALVISPLSIAMSIKACRLSAAKSPFGNRDSTCSKQRLALPRDAADCVRTILVGTGLHLPADDRQPPVPRSSISRSPFGSLRNSLSTLRACQ